MPPIQDGGPPRAAMLEDELVSSVTPYVPRHWLLHAYASPFFVLYAVWLYCSFSWVGIEEHFEGVAIAGVAILIVQILTGLCCAWSVHLKCLLTCSQVRRVRDASVVKVVPTPNNGSAEIVKLFRKEGQDCWFVFQKVKYIYEDEKKSFRPLKFPDDHSVRLYQEWKGLTEEEAASRKQHYGDNRVEMVIPEFMELFWERAVAPFFVFQVFCVLLWCLDEYWYYSVFTLVMLVMFECTLVKQQMRNMAEIKKMGNQPVTMQVYRGRKWTKIPSDQLVPGDVVSVSKSLIGGGDTTSGGDTKMLIPCDIILLRGSCIVDESALTGESVPQMKESLETLADCENEYFNMDTHGRLHVLFGGTKVVQHSAPKKEVPGLRPPDGGVLGYVMRTGFNTSQGKLLRTILFGVKRVTANNLETFFFILFLLVFAIAAATYLWVEGTKDPSRNRYKLFLECTLILTMVVPPELPIELSLAVNSSLLSLTKLLVFCTEPFRIPFAGKVDICCFDKTGTLTSDNLMVEGVAGLQAGEDTALTKVDDLPVETVQVLASCHSLSQTETELIGDPLEKVALSAIDWKVTKADSVVPKKGRIPGMRLVHRFHFSAALKRMSVIAGYTAPMSSDIMYIATVKGAAEVLKERFKNPPDSYDETYLEFSRRGARVLALGRKELGCLSPQELKALKREEVEADLDFAGFLVISCPLKPDSKLMMREIIHSSHSVVMITGDNPLTACHVARELLFTRMPCTLILTRKEDDSWSWKSVNETVDIPFASLSPVSSRRPSVVLWNSHDLCLTGEGLTFLQSTCIPSLKRILPHVKVFARVTPKQKEFIITSLKAMGYVTLMCGDGTNDVGALKHAHVGVAILSGFGAEKMPTPPSAKEQKTASNPPSSQTARPRPLTALSAAGPGGSRRGGAGQRLPREHPNQQRLTETQQQLQQLLKEIDEAEKAALVQLGDASIAAPFTSKKSSISSVCHIIKQGRCTLVTTLQMFKILALNALILAYSQSVLYLDGVKFSDSQATLSGLLLAACFLFISRSKPLRTLSHQRPLPNIFNVYTILTVFLQFAVHFSSLVYLVAESKKLMPPRPEGTFPDLEKEFEPNILNSTVFMISLSLQTATFAINYGGPPFMESLKENKGLLYAILGPLLVVALLAMGLSPGLAEFFQVVEFPEEFRKILVTVLILDFGSSFVLDRLLQFLFGRAKQRIK
ncbi:unnamed protein product [Cyprideis torosa]|uniref:Manganese-transporting ATPase 13A1 n=1 Tax=Cyprideis torosa TaxID=163714 RepID=A0A7R8WA43_9CRUS|nr:unnamed protein product [Cyprideis torosa]CAG0890511.1 unnamed protein product [Cyprideis torosa]